MFPQPEAHEWEAEERKIIDFDGAGAPIYKKYRRCTLRVRRRLGRHEWDQYVDGATHTVTLPAPGTTDDWTDYTGVYVEYVNEAEVEDASAFGSLEMGLGALEA